jgi:hypothetical protein
MPAKIHSANEKNFHRQLCFTDLVEPLEQQEIIQRDTFQSGDDPFRRAPVTVGIHEIPKRLPKFF